MVLSFCLILLARCEMSWTMYINVSWIMCRNFRLNKFFDRFSVLISWILSLLSIFRCVASIYNPFPHSLTDSLTFPSECHVIGIQLWYYTGTSDLEALDPDYLPSMSILKPPCRFFPIFSHIPFFNRHCFNFPVFCFPFSISCVPLPLKFQHSWLVFIILMTVVARKELSWW